MRRPLLLAAALLALIVALAPNASAGDQVRQGYERSAGVPSVGAAPDRTYVGATAGVETARAFVAAPRPFTLVTATTTGTPSLGACPLTSPLTADGAQSAGSAPTADCSTVTPVVADASGAWLVTMEPWPANGVAVVPVLSPGTTFEIAFDATATKVEPMAAAPRVEPAPASAPALTPTAAPAFTAPVTDTAPAPALVVAADAPPAVPSASTPAAASPVTDTVVRALAASPPAYVVLPLVALAVGGMLLLVRRRPALVASASAPARPLGAVAALAVLPAVVLSEANVYKLGLVLIVLTAAIGLHLLVTWAGELSLAQAPLVGLPAFTVAKLAADHGVSPLYLLPLAVAVGALAGAIVGIPALRARGLQVALVTLAAGVAIDRFFFTRTWVVGPPGGASVPAPSLGPLHLSTSRSLWPILVSVVAAGVAAAWMIDRSKVGRGLRWVKAHPDAAASFGIPVSRYRASAYAMAGAFAGLAGGLSTMWVQRMTPQAFPLSLSFTYLIIVALAGRGFVGGVAAAALAVEGGRLFLAGGGALIAYAAPLGLILTLTRHQTGLNGLGRQAVALIKERIMTPVHTPRRLPALRVRTIIGYVVIAVGFAAIGLAWYHAGNTDQVWVQNQELLSGGIGGLALVVAGSALVVVDWLANVLARRDPAA